MTDKEKKPKKKNHESPYGRRKLSMKIARQIREEFKNGERTIADFAEQYGIHRNTVNNILQNRTWKEGCFGKPGRKPGKTPS